MDLLARVGSFPDDFVIYATAAAFALYFCLTISLVFNVLSPETTKHKRATLPATVFPKKSRKQLQKLLLPIECIVQSDSDPSNLSLSPKASKSNTNTNANTSTNTNTKPNSKPDGVTPPRLGSIRPAISRYMHKERTPKYSLVEMEPAPEILTGRTPLLVFVNRKSGGQQGELLLYQLRTLLNDWQVYDLQDGGPAEGLRLFSKVPMFRILVCGGDGTVAWVLSHLDKLELEYKPPLGVLPIGTGNDLARVLGCGGGQTISGASTLPVLKFLFEVARAQICLLDRWNITFKLATNGFGAGKGAKSRKRSSRRGTKAQTKVMNNYLGIGVDAQIALNFHTAREEKPHLFTSRFFNKYFWYLRSGTKEVLMHRFSDFSTQVILECDGKRVVLPRGIEGLIVLNIESYGAGSDLWGAELPEDDSDSEDEYSELHSPSGRRSLLDISLLDSPRHPRYRARSLSFDNFKRRGERPSAFQLPSFQDKLIEVVGVSSSFQLGATKVGLTRPKRLCQGGKIKIRTTEALPVQLDGEPFRIGEASEITITHANQAHVLNMTNLHGAADKANLTTEVLDWGQTSGVINSQQREVLLGELSRRMHEARKRSETE